jgi:hypothetical protein
VHLYLVARSFSSRSSNSFPIDGYGLVIANKKNFRRR